MTSVEVKQLKVDNWGLFFLQRLQILLDKGEQCDLILKFKNGKHIKVHKLVLTACTDFFEKLPRDGSELQMPNILKYEHVLPIINFMYTGKLEYNVNEHSMFYDTAKALNLTILARLLDTQMKSKPPIQSSVLKSYSRKPATPAISQSIPSSPTPSTSTPGATSTPSALPGKKLPIWKKRTVTAFLADEVPAPDATPVPKVKAEIARPTRFEWPEDFEEPPVVYNPTFDNLSYDTKPMLKPVDNLTPLNVVLKGASGITDTPSTPKSFKRIGPSIVLGGSRKKRVKLSERVFSAPESDDDDDDHFETHYLDDDDDDEEFLPQTPVTSSNTTSPKPILKPLSSDTATPSPAKKVRFSLSTSEGKENTSGKEGSAVNEISTPTTNISFTSEGAKSANSANHAKIIAEVLKKYPDLVKGNKNIKLKIVTPSSGTLPSTTLATPVNSDKDLKTAQAKVSYVVMKSDPNIKKPNKPALPIPLTGPENTTGPWMCVTCGTNLDPLMFDTYYLYRKHLHNVHNERIDARICEHCGYKASKRNLHLYHLYTKHNIPPPRNINFPKCDKCDYIALSESLLIKHRNNHSTCTKEYMCRICNAAFKSNGALQGHMQTNLHQDGAKKDYECEYCGKIFNRNINLKAHIRTSHQEESRKLYDDEERVDDPQSDQNILQVIEVPVINSVQSNEKGHALLLQPGMTILAESPNVPLMPSSESEAMNNVATGIATSINIADATDMVGEQTVILLDDNSEYILQSTPMVLNQDVSCQEYIVPEIMTSESGQVYSTGLVNYTVGNGIYTNNVNNSMIEENMIKSSDHTYADDGTPHLGQSNVQVNGCTEVRVTDNVMHENSHHQGVIIINASEERGSDDETQVTSEILIDNSSGTLLMDADWVHVNNISHETEVVEDKNQIEVITPDSGVGSDNLSSIVADNEKTDNVNKMVADSLVKEWDLDDDTVEDDDQDDNDIKPSRPTIELDETILSEI